MHVPPHRFSPGRKQRLLAALAASAASLSLCACASPGLPKPPSLHLPAVVTDLTAQRVGDEVHLHWTSPSRTTDGMEVPSPMMAEVCREKNPSVEKPVAKAKEAPAPQNVAGCDVVLHLTLKPGSTQADDRLPAALTVDPVSLLGYRIRTLNPHGHSAGFSKMALAAAGQAPEPVAGLQATPTRNGALIEWQPVDSASLVELDRQLPSAQTTKPAKKSDVSLPEDQPAEIRLRTRTDKIPAKDPGGTVDRTTARGQQYVYRGQRIRRVELAGKTLELRSAVSAPIKLAMADRFPPEAPAGLASIPGREKGSPTIDLSWQASFEGDVAGYNVYRRSGLGEFRLLTEKALPGPAFSDAAVTVGETYTYRVTAVDNDGNESKASEEITETVRPE